MVTPDELAILQRDVAVLSAKFDSIQKDLNEANAETKGLRDDVKALRGTLIAFAFTIAAACVAALVTVLQVAG